ncbi:probable inactive receptor kinase At1g27190 [Malania oleifera]|uniref:probable inactive receptor kinase At1g27190 n=1 Tax=Malania oleifera TaxID=397392 RepID=UPI0025AE6FD1|nr:probable inactive receptor kinase At1g27190 [Malania oleifera]
MKKSFFNLTLAALPVFFLFLFAASAATEDDVKCLEGVKKALNGPEGSVLSWNFTNTSAAVICKLNGLSCFNGEEIRLFSLQLPSRSLAGRLPDSLQYCRSLQTLDFSGNQLSGSIPPQICTWLPYLVRLDLSGNDLSGPIPPELVYCQYLNDLILGNNRLSGPIPYELSQLDRLKYFSVEHNDLSGSVPIALAKFDAAGFRENRGLCGKPLASRCHRLSGKSLAIIIAAGVFGALGSLLSSFAIWWWFLGSSSRRKGRGLGNGNDDVYSSWVEQLWSHKKIKLTDLMAATDYFSTKSILNSNRTGVSYKAVLRDGSVLAIKRLSNCRLGEKHFRSEMNRLGQLRHPNLVPLLGFCGDEDDKLLVYKHMPNGTLYSVLHGGGADKSNTCNESYDSCPLDWRTRLQIGFGAARGLAWLHHGCQPPFVQQNISSTVILLDDDLDARITDFGLAKLMGFAACSGGSVIDEDFGEYGYVAPEYTTTMVASLEGDVYGFGVVLLELVTGQKPLEVSNAEEGFKGNLVDWVSELSGCGRSRDAIDKALCGKGYDEEILQVLKLACNCVVSWPKDRPSMDRVYESLKSMAEKHGFLEQYDELPLHCGIHDLDYKE